MLGALVAACLGALTTAACNPATEQYFREGAGSDLYSAQLAEATELQDQYVYYICRQAHNPSAEGADGSSCVPDWTTFTLAGMNDIDRRCDAYLNWLDAQRRDRTPVLTQIAAMGGSAAAIMGVAGAGTQALSIVATAFGLAGTTYANWNSRLLLDVDHSTVQTVVYTRQQQYRKDNLGVIVPDRAAAIYVLRGYLRICMPITIETDINTSVIMVRNDAPQSLLQKPLVRAVATAPLMPGAKVAQQERKVGTVFDFSPILTAYNRENDTVENLQAPLRALCANDAQIKDINKNVSSLQQLIKFYQFLSTYQLGDTSLSPEVTGRLTPAQLRDLRKPSAVSGKPLVCQLSDVAANFYEFFGLPHGLKGKIALLNRALPADKALDSNNASVKDIRNAMEQVRKAIPTDKLPSKNLTADDQFTPDLNNYLLLLPKR